MVEKHDRIWAIYPEYFDGGITRKLGRKVRKEVSQPSPTLDELFECAKKLGLAPVKEPNVAYPAFWWRKKGRLLVRKEWSKTETLEHLAMEYRQLRDTKGMPTQSGGGDQKGAQKKKDTLKDRKKKWKGKQKGGKGRKNR